MKQIKLAAVAMTSGPDKGKNLATAEALLRQAAAQGADWVMLPEVFTFHGPYDHLYDQAEDPGGPTYRWLGALARELKICLFAGSMAERATAAEAAKNPSKSLLGHRQVYNTAYVFNREGQEAAKYRKTHLFNLSDENGQALYRESDGYLAGEQLCLFTLEGYRVALIICYDLRFTGLFAKLQRLGAVDILAAPSAFTLKTGEAHWQLLVRARAVELQCYVFAANQTGTHAPSKASFGHAMIADPWGTNLADTGVDPGIATALVDPAWLKTVRARLPLRQNQRPELY